MKFICTREPDESCFGVEAVLRGLTPSGGLYVPETFPALDEKDYDFLEENDYPARVALILGKFFPELNEKLPSITEKAYSGFEDDDPAPVVKLDEGVFVLELWHGRTHAFKDMALSLLPYLVTESKKLLGVKTRTLVLAATSGDTGKAALEGFKDVDGTDVIVFYPENGVSAMQKKQMQTQRGGNVKVVAIKGNFDDAQSAVKEMFSDVGLKNKLAERNVELCGANSINVARLLAQIAYYFSAYADLVNAGETERGEEVDFVVPSGNFGNALACYYAKRMGLPVGKITCASDENDVLTGFMKNGVLDANRTLVKTTSPAMDILVPSNLERLVFELTGRNCDKTAEYMRSLAATGKYELSADEKKKLQADFSGETAHEEQVAETLAEWFDEYGYIADTHTGVALGVFDEYISDSSENPTVIVSTASPYKFASDVLKAIGEKVGSDEYKNLKKLESVTALPLPDDLAELTALPVIHTESTEKENAKKTVTDYIESRY